MTSDSKSEIAIIGMSCTFPGARDVRQYWENILAKVDAVGEAPPDWEAGYFFDADSTANDRTYCKRGGFLGPLARFDPAEFGVMPQSVDGTEPDHFLALRAAAEALEDAGYRHENKHSQRTAVVIGRGTYANRGNATAIQHAMAVDGVIRVLRQLHPEHSDEELAEIKRLLKESLPPFHADTAAGLVPNIISGRIANRLNLMGPNYIVDAACASSLVAVDLAMQDLISGRCDLAVAGGVHASTTPVTMVIFSHLKALSRKGQIRPFDAGADGTLLGEGVGMMVLKRLADAEQDGDRVYAVLKGIGTASDGRALGLLAPRREGEELAIRRAYQAAGVDPSSIELLEAHGTGTLVGDQVELEALNATFDASGGRARCALGSVKSMISHTMPAAGAAGLIKAALALHHKVLPPTLHCETPNPQLDLENSHFYLNTEPRPWIRGSAHLRRVGVNAFGFGGINAHAVLEEYRGAHPAPSLQRNWDSELLIFSAPDLAGVRDLLKETRATLQEAGEDFHLATLARTLNCGAPMRPVRLAIVASQRADLAIKIEQALQRLSSREPTEINDASGIFYASEPLSRVGKLAVLFPGEGAQYSNMLADLCIHFPEVRTWFDWMDSAFEGHPRGFRPSDTVYPPPMRTSDDRLYAMDAGAEAVYAANQALWALLEQFGLKPHAFVGHSTGEHSALLAAGAVIAQTREEHFRYILGVNEVFEELNRLGRISGGILLAVAGADRAVLDSLAARRDDLHIALDNCPHQVVLCGTEPAIAEVLTVLAETTAVCQRLPLGRAYHTPLFAEFSAGLKRHFNLMKVSAPRVDLYSCVTASRYPDDPEQIRELAASQWSRSVRFRETVNAMYRDGVRLFVECGARGNLTAFVHDILRGRRHAAIPINVQNRSGLRQLQYLLGRLAAQGVDLNLNRLYAGRLSADSAPVRASGRDSLPIRTGIQPLRLPADFAVADRLPAPRQQADPLSPRSVAAASPSDRVSPVVQQHFIHMQQLVASQQEVMQAFLKSRSRPASQPPEAGYASQLALSQITEDIQNGRWPFISEMVELTPGERAVLRHRFSLDRDKLFRHHTLGRQVSECDAGLTGISVVPLTVTMEIMAEAGAVLMPGQVLSGMREIRSYRWITLESDAAIEIVAQKESEPGAIRVEIRAADAGSGGPLWAEGVMLFASRYPAAPAPAPLRLKRERHSNWTDASLYADGMFHGPSFMAVRHIERTGANGTEGRLEVLAREELIGANPRPGFMTDPVILDAAGQVVAFWSQEELLPRGDIFPFRLVALSCYQPPRDPGTRLECRVSVKGVTEGEIESDIDIVDGEGKLHYRLEGWMDRRFVLPESLWDLRISSGRSLMGRPWEEPLSAYGGTAGLACSLIQNLPDELLDASHGIWAKMTAHIVLSRAERAEWDRIRSTAPAESLHWLRGRCAAKDAVRMLVRERTGTELFAADVELVPGKGDRLTVEGVWKQRLGIHPVVSLSHHGQSAVALSALGPSALVGIDLELLSQAAERYEDATFEDSERHMVEGIGSGRQGEWLLRLRCAKGAVARALGSNGGTLESLRVTRLDAESGIVYVELHKDGLSFEAHTSESQGFILSTVVSEIEPQSHQ
jgi:acyl transferase domain-containing protein